MARTTTRRDLLRRTLPRPAGDEALLRGVIDLERVTVAAYDAAARSGRLDPATRRIVELFRSQEQEHAGALEAALVNLGGIPPAAPQGRAEVERILRSLGLEAKTLGSLRGRAAVVSFAIALEEATLAAYSDAHRRLRRAPLLGMCAQIMANEGQHLVVLRTALGRDSLPNAFESGADRHYRVRQPV